MEHKSRRRGKVQNKPKASSQQLPTLPFPILELTISASSSTNRRELPQVQVEYEDDAEEEDQLDDDVRLEHRLGLCKHSGSYVFDLERYERSSPLITLGKDRIKISRSLTNRDPLWEDEEGEEDEDDEERRDGMRSTRKKKDQSMASSASSSPSLPSSFPVWRLPHSDENSRLLLRFLKPLVLSTLRSGLTSEALGVVVEFFVGCNMIPPRTFMNAAIHLMNCVRVRAELNNFIQAHMKRMELIEAKTRRYSDDDDGGDEVRSPLRLATSPVSAYAPAHPAVTSPPSYPDVPFPVPSRASLLPLRDLVQWCGLIQDHWPVNNYTFHCLLNTYAQTLAFTTAVVQLHEEARRDKAMSRWNMKAMNAARRSKPSSSSSSTIISASSILRSIPYKLTDLEALHADASRLLQNLLQIGYSSPFYFRADYRADAIAASSNARGKDRNQHHHHPYSIRARPYEIDAVRAQLKVRQIERIIQSTTKSTSKHPPLSSKQRADYQRQHEEASKLVKEMMEVDAELESMSGGNHGQRSNNISSLSLSLPPPTNSTSPLTSAHRILHFSALPTASIADLKEWLKRFQGRHRASTTATTNDDAQTSSRTSSSSSLDAWNASGWYAPIHRSIRDATSLIIRSERDGATLFDRIQQLREIQIEVGPDLIRYAAKRLRIESQTLRRKEEGRRRMREQRRMKQLNPTQQQQQEKLLRHTNAIGGDSTSRALTTTISEIDHPLDLLDDIDEDLVGDADDDAAATVDEVELFALEEGLTLEEEYDEDDFELDALIHEVEDVEEDDVEDFSSSYLLHSRQKASQVAWLLLSLADSGAHPPTKELEWVYDVLCDSPSLADRFFLLCLRYRVVELRMKPSRKLIHGWMKMELTKSCLVESIQKDSMMALMPPALAIGAGSDGAAATDMPMPPPSHRPAAASPIRRVPSSTHPSTLSSDALMLQTMLRRVSTQWSWSLQTAGLVPRNPSAGMVSASDPVNAAYNILRSWLISIIHFDPERLLTLLDSMKRQGTKPDVESYALSLDACAMLASSCSSTPKHGPLATVQAAIHAPSMSPAAIAAAPGRAFHYAQTLLADMAARNIVPDIHCMNALLIVYIRSGSHQHLQQLIALTRSSSTSSSSSSTTGPMGVAISMVGGELRRCMPGRDVHHALNEAAGQGQIGADADVGLSRTRSGRRRGRRSRKRSTPLPLSPSAPASPVDTFLVCRPPSLEEEVEYLTSLLTSLQHSSASTQKSHRRRPQGSLTPTPPYERGIRASDEEWIQMTDGWAALEQDGVSIADQHLNAQRQQRQQEQNEGLHLVELSSGDDVLSSSLTPSSSSSSSSPMLISASNRWYVRPNHRTFDILASSTSLLDFPDNLQQFMLQLRTRLELERELDDVCAGWNRKAKKRWRREVQRALTDAAVANAEAHGHGIHRRSSHTTAAAPTLPTPFIPRTWRKQIYPRPPSSDIDKHHRLNRAKSLLQSIESAPLSRMERKKFERKEKKKKKMKQLQTIAKASRSIGRRLPTPKSESTPTTASSSKQVVDTRAYREALDRQHHARSSAIERMLYGDDEEVESASQSSPVKCSSCGSDSHSNGECPGVNDIASNFDPHLINKLTTEELISANAQADRRRMSESGDQRKNTSANNVSVSAVSAQSHSRPPSDSSASSSSKPLPPHHRRHVPNRSTSDAIALITSFRCVNCGQRGHEKYDCSAPFDPFAIRQIEPHELSKPLQLMVAKKLKEAGIEWKELPSEDNDDDGHNATSSTTVSKKKKKKVSAHSTNAPVSGRFASDAVALIAANRCVKCGLKGHRKSECTNEFNPAAVRLITDEEWTPRMIQTMAAFGENRNIVDEEGEIDEKGVKHRTKARRGRSNASRGRRPSVTSRTAVTEHSMGESWIPIPE